MLNRYYHQELTALRDLGKEFAEANPAIASMLSGPTADPDVERLLEGVAFLTGLVREKLDDDFPEILHGLVQLIWPHYLRPLPASTIVAFSPKPSLKQALDIPAGVQLASLPIAGTTCLFKTCLDVQVQPLVLHQANYVERPGKSAAVVLQFELKGLQLKDWQIQRLRLHLAGDYAEACERYYLLLRYLDRITIREESGQSFTLSPDHLKPVGLGQDSGSIPYPGNAYPGYRILQEYLSMPHNFLFLDISGWERWTERGESSRFELIFELKDFPFSVPRMRKQDFVLHATPAINLFAHEADPIRLDHKRTEYRITPAGSHVDHFQVYTVDKVTGFIQGSATAREYQHFDTFNRGITEGPVYNVMQKPSPSRRRTDVYISVSYPPQAGPPLTETLSIGLTCTNGGLSEKIRIGDIKNPTSSTPEPVEFTNITAPSPEIPPPLGKNLLWRLLSLLSLNAYTLADTKNFKTLLGLYLFPDNPDRAALVANQKRLSGIESIETRDVDRLVSGLMLRGRQITCTARYDYFASRGDLYLFGSVLNEFFAVYASLNSFTHFILKEALTGDTISWPAKIGERPLI